MGHQPTTPPGRLLQIGEVAERVGLSLRTIRYYEEMRLVVPEARTEGGFRLYTEEHVDRLAFIRDAKPLGFTVHELRELLEARDTMRDPGAREGRDEAGERLRGFTATAAKRCDELRGRLVNAEQFVRQLRRETRRARS